MNLKNRLLSILLADVIATTAVGCTYEEKKNEKESVDFNSLSTSIKEEDNSYVNIEADNLLELLLKERLYDENMDYNLVLENYLNQDYELRSNMKDDYLRAVYMSMLNSGVPMNVYFKELHTLMVMQQIPTGLPEEIWHKSFGNLIALSKENSSLYEMFIDFAIYVHELTCEEEHKLNECCAYTCKKLEDDLKLNLIK